MRRRPYVWMVVLILLSLGVVIDRTFLRHKECPRLSFSERRLPATALASYPGSGNTWLRHLLHKATGVATGSMYRDSFLKRGGFIGEGIRDEFVSVIKTHDIYRNSSQYDRVILLVRNPYEALLSEFKRRFSKPRNNSHLVNLEMEAYFKDWNNWINRAKGFKGYYLTWLRQEVVLPIFYDDLKKDLRNQLSKTLDFLGLDGDIWCAVKDSEGVAHRKHSDDPPLRFLYNKEKRKEINDIILSLQDSFRERFKTETFHMEDWLL